MNKPTIKFKKIQFILGILTIICIILSILIYLKFIKISLSGNNIDIDEKIIEDIIPKNPQSGYQENDASVL
ncbi:hypothetical protein A2229_01840 [Candidatus Peregrinibacteria bacterium RIFOXYA2_FULL_33_7]|nr:MAG: hypothetical protein A2229_01840 [Candidatus Peregrinibacteria bacterium RIFOXYA2_FULL_33_7]